MSLPYNVRYLLLQRRLLLAAEVPASEPDRRAWVTVFYREGDDVPFVVHHVEIRRSWLEPLDDIGPHHAEIYDEFRARDEAELVALLGRWLDDLNRLVDEQIAGYPL